MSESIRPYLPEGTRRPHLPFAQIHLNQSTILNNQLPVNCTMSQAVSFHSQIPIQPLPPESILAAALDEYKKNTGNDLQSHPLSAELQSCDSVHGILNILQRQANTVEKLRDRNQGIMKWVRSSVNILCSISGTLRDGASLVRLVKRTRGHRRVF